MDVVDIGLRQRAKPKTTPILTDIRLRPGSFVAKIASLTAWATADRSRCEQSDDRIVAADGYFPRSSRALCRLGDVDRLAGLAKHPLQDRFKSLERHRFEVGIEGDLIE